jgi:hypothetical protein
VVYAAQLHGLPVGPTTNKQPIIDMLLKYQAPVLPFGQMEAFADCWESLSAADREQIGAKHPKPVPVVHVPAITMPPPRPRQALPNRTVLVVPGTSVNASAAPGVSSGFEDEKFESPVPAMDAVTQNAILAQIIQSLQVLTALSSSSAAALLTKPAAPPLMVPELSPFDKMIKKAADSIATRSYFNAIALNKENLDKLLYRDHTPAASKSIRLGDLVLSSGSAKSETRFDNLISWPLWRSGFMKWLSLLALSPLSHLGADRMNWYLQVETFKNARSDWHRARYAKMFMFRYVAKDNWVEIFNTDSSLLLEMMDSQCDEESPAVVDSKRSAPAGTPGKVRHVVKKQKPSVPLCFSRSRPALGECKVGALCKFVHICPCCNKDHSAKQCPNFDQKVANAVAKKMNRRG